MKFVHTADWQIGMRAAHVGAAAQRVREERLAAARRVVEVARANSVDFVLVAGDTFEDNGIERTLVQRVIDTLAAFGGPVYVIPGNHDPLVPGSVWDHPAWRSISSLHVLRDEQPLEVPGAVLYPCPARARRSGKDPTAWIPCEKETQIRIGVAHGTVGEVHVAEHDYPIPRDAASRARLDYLALGHWHSTVLYEDAERAVRMAYSGTHETTGFGERDSGNVLVVDIPARGVTPVVTRARTGRLTWVLIEESLRTPEDPVRLRELVERLEAPDTTLLELRLDGLIHAGGREELDRVAQLLASRFLSGRIDAARARPAPDDNGWLEGLRPGVVREAGMRLRNLANSDARSSGTSPNVAGRALLELYALASEARS